MNTPLNTSWSLDFKSLLNVPATGRAPGEVTRTTVDLSLLGANNGQVANGVFGCRCSTNPSGLTPEQVAAAQRENGVTA